MVSVPGARTGGTATGAAGAALVVETARNTTAKATGKTEEEKYNRLWLARSMMQ